MTDHRLCAAGLRLRERRAHRHRRDRDRHRRHIRARQAAAKDHIQARSIPEGHRQIVQSCNAQSRLQRRLGGVKGNRRGALAVKAQSKGSVCRIRPQRHPLNFIKRGAALCLIVWFRRCIRQSGPIDRNVRNIQAGFGAPEG